MAKEREIQAWLKKEGLTELGVGEMFEELSKTNKLVERIIKDVSNSWKGLNMGAIKTIPELYANRPTPEELAEKARIAEEKVRLEEEEKKRKQAEKDAYWENFESNMVKKIDGGEDLTEDELSELISAYEVDEKAGDSGRWSQFIQTIVKLEDRLFAINWQRGLTENQEDYYDEQPYEVKCVEKTIVVKDYVALKED